MSCITIHKIDLIFFFTHFIIFSLASKRFLLSFHLLWIRLSICLSKHLYFNLLFHLSIYKIVFSFIKFIDKLASFISHLPIYLSMSLTIILPTYD